MQQRMSGATGGQNVAMNPNITINATSSEPEAIAAKVKSAPEPLVDSEWGFVNQCQRLIVSKPRVPRGSRTCRRRNDRSAPDAVKPSRQDRARITAVRFFRRACGDYIAGSSGRRFSFISY